MMILIYGSDTFRALEKMNELKAAFLKKFDVSGMNVDVVDVEKKEDAMRAFSCAMSAPFLSPKRMVIVRGIVSELEKKEIESIVELFERIPETTICILVEALDIKQMEKSFVYEKLSAAKAPMYVCSPLEGVELQKWVQTRVQTQGAVGDAIALRELIARVGNNLWQLDQEIAKLVHFSEGKPITLAAVQSLVRANPEGEIFALMDAFSQKKKSALALLQQEREAGSADMYLFTMFARQIRILLGVRAVMDEQVGASGASISQATGLHSFVAGKAIVQAKLFSLEQLKALHTKLFHLEHETKTGGVDARVAVDLLAAAFLS